MVTFHLGLLHIKQFSYQNIIHTQSPLRGMEYSIKFNVELNSIKSYGENPEIHGIIEVTNLTNVRNNIKIAPCITQRAVPILLIPVMRATLDYFYGVILNLIDYTVSIINAPAPVTRQILTQRFRFSDTRVTVSVNIFYEIQNSL